MSGMPTYDRSTFQPPSNRLACTATALVLVVTAGMSASTQTAASKSERLPAGRSDVQMGAFPKAGSILPAVSAPERSTPARRSSLPICPRHSPDCTRELKVTVRKFDTRQPAALQWASWNRLLRQSAAARRPSQCCPASESLPAAIARRNLAAQGSPGPAHRNQRLETRRIGLQTAFRDSPPPFHPLLGVRA